VPGQQLYVPADQSTWMSAVGVQRLGSTPARIAITILSHGRRPRAACGDGPCSI